MYVYMYHLSLTPLRAVLPPRTAAAGAARAPDMGGSASQGSYAVRYYTITMLYCNKLYNIHTRKLATCCALMSRLR